MRFRSSICIHALIALAGAAFSHAAETYPAMEGEEARTRPVYRGDDFGDLADEIGPRAKKTRSQDIPIPPSSHQPIAQAPGPVNNRAPAPSAITVEPPKQQAKAKKAAMPARVAKQPTRTQRTPPMQPVASKFDAVPGEQRESIARRLELAEQLVRVHGRAYDYRLMTVAQLEAILAELEAKSPDALSVTAPPVQDSLVESTASPIRAEIPPLPGDNDPRMAHRLRLRAELRDEPTAPLPPAAPTDRSIWDALDQ